MKTFIEKQVKDVTVTEEEIQAFYARIKAEVEKSGKTFEDVRPAIIQSQLSPKKQEATAVFIRGQGKTRSIQVSQKWIADNSAAVRDNVLDKAIGKGKPVLVEFGRKEGCPWCKQMEPVLKEIGQMKAEALDIIMVETPEEPALAARFNITGVPVQVYFDKDGKQVFSHVGFFAKEDLLKRLTESGLK
jgi:thioredoxin 1